jgi:hypothetical protein
MPYFVMSIVLVNFVVSSVLVNFVITNVLVMFIMGCSNLNSVGSIW